MANLYPLRLEPYVKEVVWGGRWLAEALGRPGKPDANLGESWEAYSDSVITNGELSGRKLGDLFTENGVIYFGSASMGYPKFPLLVKFIDAKANLSVQVHPTDEMAQKLENYPFGKTEFWYVIAAEPGAEICYSLNEKAETRDQLVEAIRDNDLLRYLQRSPVKAGDVVYLPAGTVHALTEGIVVYELQQDCDITYRLYDWGRVGREIHIEKGLQVINLDYKNMQVTHPAEVAQEGYQQARLVESEYFTANVWDVTVEANLSPAHGSFTLLTVLEGAGNLSGEFTTELLDKGDTVLIPTGLAYTLTRTSDSPFKVIGGWLR